MNRLMKFLRHHSGPGVLVALVVLVLAVGVGLGSGEGVVRWRDVEARVALARLGFRAGSGCAGGACGVVVGGGGGAWVG